LRSIPVPEIWSPNSASWRIPTWFPEIGAVISAAMLRLTWLAASLLLSGIWSLASVMIFALPFPLVVLRAVCV
jgi:hypothetical protein